MIAIVEPSGADVPHLSSFLRKAWAEAGPGSLGWVGASDVAVEELASESFLTALLAREDTRVLAAVAAGEVIGLAVLRRTNATSMELAGLILLESRTGQGVGRALLSATLERARSEGATDVVVRTETANDRALRFYQRCGFVIESRGLEEVEGIRVSLATLRCHVNRGPGKDQ